MKAKSWLIAVFILLGLVSCGEQPLIDESRAIDGRRWFREQEPIFTVKVDSPTTAYDLFLNIRNSVNFQFSDLFLEVEQRNPDSSKVNYVVKIKMTNGEGLWIGKGSGNLYSQQVRFLSDYHFPDSGMYTFKVKQNMRANPVEGIHDVGIRVTASDR